jgi:hypothetical protein
MPIRSILLHNFFVRKNNAAVKIGNFDAFLVEPLFQGFINSLTVT